MTVLEFQALAKQEFQFVALDQNDNVMFAIPIPGVNAWRFECEEDLQSFIWDDEEITAARDAWDKYIRTLPGKKNRTRKQAQEAGAITVMPNFIAIPTLKEFQFAISTVEDPNAHLQPIITDLNPRFDNGTLCLAGVKASFDELVKHYDKKPETLANLDLPRLRALYSIILLDAESVARDPERIAALINDPQYLTHSVKIYLPDFLRMMNYTPHINQESIDIAIKTIMSYSNILGVMREYKGGREYINHYPVMNFIGYEGTDNTIQFASPYINKVIMTIFQASIQKDKNGKPKLKANGQPFLRPSHSRLIKPDIVKERNKRAIEIVCVVVALIERAGNRTPHIKVRTIIERCPDLRNAMAAAATSSDRAKVMNRAFTGAWRLLRTQTGLTEVYRDIQLPTIAPKLTQLDKVFNFPHHGKKPQEDDMKIIKMEPATSATNRRQRNP